MFSGQQALKQFRQDRNGHYLIFNRDERKLSILRKYCDRVDHGGYKWKLRDRVKPARDLYPGQVCYIVGKGPSLDHLTSETIPTSGDTGVSTSGPIIAINEAIHKVEEQGYSAYCAQLDKVIKESCWSKKGQLINTNIAHLYQKHHNRIVFSYDDLGLKEHKTIGFAIAIGLYWGCSSFVFVSCDASAHGIIGYPPSLMYLPKRRWVSTTMLQHKHTINRLLPNGNYRFITPHTG